ncbi:MAG: sugar-binding domain-containing protein [Oscillospiraceae bacterium]
MISADKKLGRLIEVAELYYEQNMTQSEIAKALGISRPLVSVLLTEAKSAGVVTITINRAENREQLEARRLEARFGLEKVVVIPDRKSGDATDNAIAIAAYDFCFDKKSSERSVGVGWGSLLGRMADYAEGLENAAESKGRIFPLIGGIGASYRGYHTNEIARILSAKSGLAADYLYMPAFFDSESELDFARHMETYLALNEKWEHMDLALVNISNYPSYPDLGVEYRFANRLSKENAVGRVLAHYYDVGGRIIEATVDNVMQASIEQLRDARSVTAVCSSHICPACAVGAIAAGFINTLLLPESLATQILEIA